MLLCKRKKKLRSTAIFGFRFCFGILPSIIYIFTASIFPPAGTQSVNIFCGSFTVFYGMPLACIFSFLSLSTLNLTSFSLLPKIMTVLIMSIQAVRLRTVLLLTSLTLSSIAFLPPFISFSFFTILGKLMSTYGFQLLNFSFGLANLFSNSYFLLPLRIVFFQIRLVCSISCHYAVIPVYRNAITI